MSAMSTNSEWKLYLFGKTEAHRNWVERGKVGEGRIDLEDKNLTRAIFNGKDLTNSRFVRCDWSNSNISADFTEAEITECIWNNSLLEGIRFNRASVEKCNFVNAYLGSCDFIEAKIKGGEWSRSDLDKSTWTDAVVENVCFERVNFSEARFHGSRFVNCDLRDTNLESATLRSAVFENCDFRGAYLYDFVFEKVTFINCGFHGCVGIPAFEGEYTFIQPDLSEAFDGTGIVEQEKLLEQWKSQSPLSIPETLHPPQWLNYISRENEDDQVDWVDEGMKGSPPMDLKSEDLSKAFAYQAYFRAARFTNSDFTGSDLRRTMVQQAEFIGCKFDNALLMYLEGRQETALDVETTKVIFKDCTAKGAYFNRSELWIGEFVGGNWDGSFFNNCIWTLVEFKNVSFENTDWRGAKLDGVKFVNCNFRNALFEEAQFIAAEFYDCDFRYADFGNTTGGAIIRMERCGFYGAKGLCFDTGGDSDLRGVINADLSENFDGSLIWEFTERTEDFFFKIKSDFQGEFKPTEPKNTESKDLAKLQQELNNNQQKLTDLKAQQIELEERIKDNKKTDLFRRNVEYLNRLKENLNQEVKEIEARIAEQESLIRGKAKIATISDK